MVIVMSDVQSQGKPCLRVVRQDTAGVVDLCGTLEQMWSTLHSCFAIYPAAQVLFNAGSLRVLEAWTTPSEPKTPGSIPRVDYVVTIGGIPYEEAAKTEATCPTRDAAAARAAQRVRAGFESVFVTTRFTFPDWVIAKATTVGDLMSTLFGYTPNAEVSRWRDLRLDALREFAAKAAREDRRRRDETNCEKTTDHLFTDNDPRLLGEFKDWLQARGVCFAPEPTEEAEGPGA